MSSYGTANYEYVVARVRHRRASLFDEDDYRQLLRVGLGGIARQLEESEYRPEIDALGTRYSGVQLIEYALHRNLARHFDELLTWSDGELYDLVVRYLRKFDAWNVKTVLRGTYSGASEEEIEENLVDAGEFDDSFLEELVAAPDIETIVSLLEGTIFGEAAASAFPDFEETDLLVPLENAIDRAYYEGLAQETGDEEGAMELYQEFLQAEIDFRNIRNALRIARSGADIDPTEYFIEGGALFSRSEIGTLVTTPEDLVSRLRESRYGEGLSGELSGLRDAESLIPFERALHEALVSYADYLSHVYPLSVCPVLAYILAKEREVDNVLAIAHGKEVGLDREEIETELVML
ncbi:MAG: V-type ATP synthase subunit C [Halodesulfurarchaeum sp.]